MAFGITNQCHNKKFIPFFDYDINNLFTISTELKTLQENYNLSNIYLIESSKGVNAFSLDMIPFKTLKQIYSHTKYVDKLFIKWSIARNFSTLRMGNDKKYLTVIENNNITYKKSNVHKLFFIDIMKFPIKDNINFDNNDKITITCFPSNRHGYPMERFENV